MALAADSAVGRVEALLERADPAALELAGALLELYGEGLGRLLSYDDGTLVRAAAGDDLVAHLLLLHDLHPVAVEDRVQAALDEVRPYLDSHGGAVELVRVQDGVAVLRMEGSCKGCPSSTLTLRHAIEQAVFKAAPDVERVEAEDAPAPVLEVHLPSATWTPIAFTGDGPMVRKVDG